MSYYYGKLMKTKSASKRRDYVLYDWPLKAYLPDQVTVNIKVANLANFEFKRHQNLITKCSFRLKK